MIVEGTSRISGGVSTVSLSALHRLLPASSAAQDHLPLSGLFASGMPNTDMRRPSASSDTVRVQMSLKTDALMKTILVFFSTAVLFLYIKRTSPCFKIMYEHAQFSLK